MDERIRAGGEAYERYRKLILERDRLEKEALLTESAWLREFGQLTTDVLLEQIECVKLRVMLGFYQEAADRGVPVDQEELIAYLQRELADDYMILEDMQDHNEAARRRGRTVTEYEDKRIQALYQWIAKRLHPALHPETEKREELRIRWIAAVIAYHANDLLRLVNEEILLRKTFAKLGITELAEEVPDIDLRIREAEAEIGKIRTTEPYTWRGVLEDSEASAAKKAALEAELAEYRGYREQMGKCLDELMR
ncbi:MAG: hypothetical protein K6F13_04380 [Lachnospiraceae bacterium]|nr:hypothetical protein [Lachnospiraceae bacterium]